MLCALLLTLLGGATVENGDFETKGQKDDPVPGWVLDVGAMNGAKEPLSKVEIDTKEKHGGRASLHLRGDDSVRAWRGARQEIAARPGATYKLSAFMKSANVRGETVAGTSIQQFQNCYVALFLSDDAGEIVAKDYAKAPSPTSPWHKVSIELTAPETVRKAKIYVFLSMSGDFWVDDVALSIEGGHDLPPEETLLREGFEKLDKLPADWKEAVGAHNGTGGKRSTIAIDAKEGVEGSPRSLHFAGDANTIQWYSTSRTFDVKPGDAVRLSAMVKAANVRKERIQFPNFHLWLEFKDEAGKAVGPPQIAAAGGGTYDWKLTRASGVAPEGAKKVELGLFLSMSGDAYVDRIELVKRSGSTPAYADWTTLESKHVIVRSPKDMPRATHIKGYADRLDAAFETVCKRLDVKFDDTITAWIYRDGEQGKRLTGKPLAFAAPEDRAFHQTMDNTISHEMTHVIALKMGYAQVPLLGEGIAVWLDGGTDKSHHLRAAKLLADGKVPALDALLSDFRADESVSYPAGGSLCGYLIETFGLDAFKRLYVVPDPRKSALQILDKSFDDVDREWREFLSKQG